MEVLSSERLLTKGEAFVPPKSTTCINFTSAAAMRDKSTAGPSRGAEGSAPGEGRAAGRERGCGSDAARGARQLREPRAGWRTGSRPTASLSLSLLPGARSAQGSAASPAPRYPQRRGPKRPRGAQPYGRTAVPRRRCSAPGASGRFLGQRLRGRLLRPLLGAGLGSPRPDRSPRRRENEIEINPGPRDGEAAVAGLRTAVPTRPRVSRSRHEGTRRAAPTSSGAPFCGAKSLRRGAAMAAAPGDGGAADTSLPPRTTPLGKLSPRGPRPRRGPGRSPQSPALGDPAARRARAAQGSARRPPPLPHAPAAPGSRRRRLRAAARRRARAPLA